MPPSSTAFAGAMGDDATCGKANAVTYVEGAVSGAATLMQEMPLVGIVCKTFLSFEKLAGTAKNNKAELAVLCELCDVVIKGVLEKRTDRSGLFKGFVALEKHVGKAEKVAKLCNGAGIYALKRFVLAQKICKDIASVRKNVLDLSTANNLVLTHELHAKVDNLATVLAAKEKELEAREKRASGEYSAEEMEAFFRHTLALEEGKLGKDHPTVACTLHNLGGCASSAGRTKDAEGYYRRALAIREKRLGGDHPDVARSLHELGMCSWKLGRTAEADELFRRALDVGKAKLGSDHPDVAKTRTALAKLRLSTSLVTASKVTLAVTGVLLCVRLVTRSGRTSRPSRMDSFGFSGKSILSSSHELFQQICKQQTRPSWF